MKHAQDAALDRLNDLLELLRQRPLLQERKRGVFYRGSRAFLHFHQDPSGLYADVRPADDWERFDVTAPDDWKALIGRVDVALFAAAQRRGKA